MGTCTSAGDDGQSNIDFLFGVAVFLLTFLYVATFIPGLFVPYQPGAIDLSSVAYRTSAILAEDPGWFSRGTVNGTTWEENIYDLSRVGLADDKDHPNMVSQDKINGLNAILANSSNYTIVRDHLGLNGTNSYDINVSVKLLDGGRELVNTAAWPAPSNYRVESMERNVAVDMGKEMFIDAGKDRNNTGSIFTVNITNRPSVVTKNLTIRVFNTTGTIGGVTPSLDGSTFIPLMVYDTDYVFKLNGAYNNTGSVTVTPNDVVEIVVFPNALNTYPIMYLRIDGSGSMFGDSSIGVSFNYYSDLEYPLKSVCYPGIMRLEVWSDELA